jgi:hypothetical protein
LFQHGRAVHHPRARSFFDRPRIPLRVHVVGVIALARERLRDAPQLAAARDRRHPRDLAREAVDLVERDPAGQRDRVRARQPAKRDARMMFVQQRQLPGRGRPRHGRLRERAAIRPERFDVGVRHGRFGGVVCAADQHFEAARIEHVILLVVHPPRCREPRHQPVDVPDPAQPFRLHDQPEARIAQERRAQRFARRIGAVQRDDELEIRIGLALRRQQRFLEKAFAAVHGKPDRDRPGCDQRVQPICRIRSATALPNNGAIVSFPVSMVW